MKKNTVLFIEWNTSGREFDMQFPLMYFFAKKLNWNVEYKCSFNLPSITASVPDLVILSSTGGAARGLQVLKWCHQSNIPVFSSFTEGMFREKDLDEFLWGWNKSRNFRVTTGYKFISGEFPYGKDSRLLPYVPILEQWVPIVELQWARNKK